MKTPTLLHSRSALGLAMGFVLVHTGCDSFQNPDSASVAALNLVVAGDFSGGSIVSQPAGIDCGSVCSSLFNIGTKVELTVTPSDSSDFVGWEGACTGSSTTCSLTMDSGKNVTATFRSKLNRANISVTLGGAGGGSVSSQPFGIQCAGSCNGGYDKGTMVTLTAEPDSTSVFSGWTGACTGAARTCTLTLTDDVQVMANFANPTSCEQIRADNPTATNGNRKLFVNGDKTKAFDVYCHMAATPALTYLNLTKTTATDNFSQFTTGGGATGTTVKTSYTKVRIDPATLKVDTNDMRFASSTGAISKGATNITSMPYATAIACGAPTAGAANIDLTGTQFAVATNALGLGGTTPTGTTTPTPNGQIRVLNLTGNGGGNCGWNAPVGSNNPYNMGGSPLDLVFFP